MSYTIYSYPENPNAWKTVIAGAYAGIDVEYPTFEFGKENKSKDFLSKFPVGKVPALDTPEGPLFESNAMARYVGKKAGLYGSNDYEAAQIDQWIDFASNEIYLPAAAWLYPIMGFVPNNKVATGKAKGDVRKALGVLNKHLENNTFLVGERFSLADVVVSMECYRLYKMVLDNGFRKAFPHTNRWYLTCVNQPNVKKVIGEVELCKKMMLAPIPEGGDDAGGKKKENNKKKQQGGGKKKEAAAQPKPKPKKKANPLDSLPKSSFVIDEWKRVYSNEDTRPTAIPWLWENFDPEGWTFWWCDYKFNDECEKMFMTANLVGGFIQRLDAVRKYGFASILVLGKEPKLSIKGIFIVRGSEIPEVLSDCVDYEYYNWTKADHTNAEEKELIEDFLAWDGKLGGAEFDGLNGKVFK